MSAAGAPAGEDLGPAAAPPAPPPEFDPFSEEFFGDPTALYRRLRDECPVYHSARYGFWALSRHADVVAAHRDWESLTSTHGVDLVMLRTGRPAPEPRSLIMLDPPEHHRMRALVSREFSPRAVAALEPMVRAVAASFLDSLDGRCEFDAVVDLAGPLPVEVIARLLGVPAADRQQLRHWVDHMLERADGLALSDGARRAQLDFGRYVFDLVRDRRRHLEASGGDGDGDDLLARLCLVEVEREDGGRTVLDDVEITAFAALVAAAGAETVTKLLGSALVLFARHLDQWRRVLEDPGRVPGAVEEVLRYWPPSQYQGRFAVRPVTFSGTEIPAGSPVLLLTGSATRDERAFEDPDRLDVGRSPSLALGFGHGIHACLGAALARLESRVVLEEWARRHPVFEVDEDGLRRVRMANVAGFSHVPVRVPAPA